MAHMVSHSLLYQVFVFFLFRIHDGTGFVGITNHCSFFSTTVYIRSRHVQSSLLNSSIDDDNVDIDKSLETNTAAQPPPPPRTTTTSPCTIGDIWQAACLIAGTTVGGGFLALPTVVAPSGFIPSAVGMLGVWVYFAGTSWVIVECLVRARYTNSNSNISSQSTPNKTESATFSATNDDDTFHRGIAAAAQSVFGPIGKAAIVILLVVLTEATLVSQISRAGSLVSGVPYRLGCLLSTLSMTGLVFGTQRHAMTFVNSVLTALFGIMAMVLFGDGAPAADWSRLTISSNWKTLPSALPTLLQLLVYGEILPTICRLLRYQIRPIRWAIGWGSLLPLILQIGWAGLGIGLLGSSSSSSALNGGDPVDLLLATGPVKTPLFIMAMTAIATTIIGSFLALESALEDYWSPSNMSPAHGKDGNTRNSQWKRKTRVAALVSVPSLLIASISPQVFLKAIDFAGSYPVLLLWGLAPPAILWKQRQRAGGSLMELPQPVPTKGQAPVSPIPKSWLVGLTAISGILIGMSAVPDLCHVWRALKGFLVLKNG